MKNNHSYDIQKSITTKTKWKGLINFSDVMFIAIYMLILLKIRDVFPPKYAVYIVILNGLTMLFWILPSRVNYNMKHAQSLMRVLFHRGKTYHAIDHKGNSIRGGRQS